MKENLFTKKEAEALLSVNASELLDLLESGELEHILIDGRVRVSEYHIEHFNLRHCVGVE